MTDRTWVHAGNAWEQFLHRKRTLLLVHTVSEQLLKRSKNLSGTVSQCEHSHRVVQAECSGLRGDVYQIFSQQ